MSPRIITSIRNSPQTIRIGQALREVGLQHCPQSDSPVQEPTDSCFSRPHNCKSSSGSTSRVKLNDENTENNRRIGSRGRDCWRIRDGAPSRSRARKSRTSAFVELRTCANLNAGVWQLPLQSHGVALVQPCRSGFLVDRATRARRQGKAGFFRVGNIFDMAKT